MFRFLLNLLWFLLGGVVMGLGWWLAGLLCAITIVGLPWARSCFVIGTFSFWPFGQEAVSRRELSARDGLALRVDSEDSGGRVDRVSHGEPPRRCNRPGCPTR